jgi:hypothetical protein
MWGWCEDTMRTGEESAQDSDAAQHENCSACELCWFLRSLCDCSHGTNFRSLKTDIHGDTLTLEDQLTLS